MVAAGKENFKNPAFHWILANTQPIKHSREYTAEKHLRFFVKRPTLEKTNFKKVCWVINKS